MPNSLWSKKFSLRISISFICSTYGGHSIVEELFDYCQILEAYITKDGWEFLTKYHGYEQLYEIDKRSGWFDEETIDAFKEAVKQVIDESIDHPVPPAPIT